jgi:hypothetical protein
MRIYVTFGIFDGLDGFEVCGIVDCLGGSFSGVDSFDALKGFVDGFNAFNGSGAINGIDAVSGIVFLIVVLAVVYYLHW